MERDLKRYRIRYQCALDPGCPVFAMHVKAYDRAHAEERFWESTVDPDWKIVSVEARPIEVRP